MQKVDIVDVSGGNGIIVSGGTMCDRNARFYYDI